MKTILVVDDQVDLREILSFKFRKSGFHVIEKNSAISALEIMDKEKIDCLVTDYVMPEMDGLDLVEKMRDLGIKIPVFMITAYEECPRQRALNCQISAIVFKPFDTEELIMLVRNSLK